MRMPTARGTWPYFSAVTSIAPLSTWISVSSTAPATQRSETPVHDERAEVSYHLSGMVPAAARLLFTARKKTPSHRSISCRARGAQQ